ncbi:Anaphase-promoting complex subunit 10 [Fasciola gigantica]|uniref:Anaphase-promoting complex subunit 10 n=1 Tax=Fasciola gigantica TaxID=46835 RepID=A0A504Y770_FASGI|nr:Anaphase-promoting complex subunit 10 [Fasciola gigantica]
MKSRKIYPNKNMHEMDEATLFKVALDYYTTQRREKLHATRLELLKKMKIAEEDAEKLRDGRFSEIPMNRLTVYRKRCRAFGIADIIGEQLKLDPLPPATETENQTIRESLTVPEFLNRSIGDEITDPNGGRWFPLRGTFRDVFGYKSEADEQNAISEFLNAQAFLCRRIGTEFPEDETSSLDTSSSVRTHPEDPPIPVSPECPESSMMEPVVVEVTETASKAPASPSADPLSTQAHPTKLLLPRHNPAPLSPCSSSALVSDTDTLASPPVGQSHTSSPSVGQSDPQSPSLRPSARRARNKRSRKSIIQTTASMTSGDLDHALSPVVSECGTTDDGTTNSAALLDVTLARRWRRGLLSALSTVCSHRHAYVFMHPVTEDIAPGYSSVVYEPVDLTSLRRRLEAALASLASGSATSATVPSPKQLLIDAATRFIRDLMLMFVNARMYNSSNHEVHKMAGDMFNDVIGESINIASPPRKRHQSSSSDLSQRLKALTSIDVTKDEREGKVRDVCRKAIWSLSSCKPGHGIEQLMDGSTDTFWQSDGPQPHCVTIQFPQKTALTRLCLYTDYKADESYTPSRLAVRVGNTIHDLIELVEIELHEPTGWSVLPLVWLDGSPVRTFMLQLAVLANHQNGRDTHLRAIRLHSPIEPRGLDVLSPFEFQDGRVFTSFR